MNDYKKYGMFAIIPAFVATFFTGVVTINLIDNNDVFWELMIATLAIWLFGLYAAIKLKHIDKKFENLFFKGEGEIV